MPETPIGASAETAAALAEPQRLYLHIGMAKSGSSFLQSVLATHRAELRAHGYVYPYVGSEGMFHAAVEMAGRPEFWGLDEHDIRGTFAQLLRRGRFVGGRVVISHEIFGTANRGQIEAIAEQLAGFEVHVVVTVRSAGRAITGQWQEMVKNGRPESFEEFATKLVDRIPSEMDGILRGFWKLENIGWLLDRWTVLAPPDRTHVVVTPTRRAGPEELWRRFAQAIEFPADAVDLSQVRPVNESLGVPQIAFLRQVLAALDGRIDQPWYSRVVKRWFAQTLLSQVASPRPVTPRPVAERLTAVSQGWIDFVRTHGYRVYGDLDELVPDLPDPGSPHPDEAAPAEMFEGLPDVVAQMLLRTSDLSVTVARLEAENRSLADERDRLAGRLSGRAGPAWRRRRWWPF